MSVPVAGWYPHPTDPSQAAYWDGQRWAGTMPVAELQRRRQAEAAAAQAPAAPVQQRAAPAPAPTPAPQTRRSAAQHAPQAQQPAPQAQRPAAPMDDFLSQVSMAAQISPQPQAQVAPQRQATSRPQPQSPRVEPAAAAVPEAAAPRVNDLLFDLEAAMARAADEPTPEPAAAPATAPAKPKAKAKPKPEATKGPQKGKEKAATKGLFGRKSATTTEAKPSTKTEPDEDEAPVKVKAAKAPRERGAGTKFRALPIRLLPTIVGVVAILASTVLWGDITSQLPGATSADPKLSHETSATVTIEGVEMVSSEDGSELYCSPLITLEEQIVAPLTPQANECLVEAGDEVEVFYTEGQPATARFNTATMSADTGMLDIARWAVLGVGALALLRGVQPALGMAGSLLRRRPAKD